MTEIAAKHEIHIDELRARKPNLEFSNFPTHEAKSITTTVLIEGDVIRVVRDHFKQGNFNEYNRWVDAIKREIEQSLQLSLLDIVAVDHVVTTTTIQFDRK